METTTEVIRAYRVALDPTTDQEHDLARHAGAARWAYNHAIAVKMHAHAVWRQEVAWSTYDTLSHLDPAEAEKAARKSVKVRFPTKPAIQKALNAVKGDSRTGVDGACPWWHEVSTYAFQSALADADAAWATWMASYRGTRSGRRVGYPRFKSKRRIRPSFRLHHDVKKPTIRPEGCRRLVMPRIGSVRLHGNVRHLARRIRRGTAVIQSVTISRGGSRWYASILVKQHVLLPTKPTPRQERAGTVGVDLGVHHLAALSDGTLIANPRHLRAASRRLRRAQQALARTKRDSSGRAKARKRVARLHHQLAERRHASLHQLTKHMATSWATIGIEDLNVAGMTASAKGTLEEPGANVRAKAGLNRSVLDVSPGELRRQLTYKTTWYGSTLHVIDRWAPTSKTCSACGTVKPKLALAERRYTCTNCGLVINRDVNAARNIAALARAGHATPVASDAEETQNARRGRVSPGTIQAAPAETGRPPPGSPRPSNRPAVPTNRESGAA
ncbi:MAG: RNA-guided endonuclease TnpB family protein [Ornithinimicrobium sp.]